MTDYQTPDTPAGTPPAGQPPDTPGEWVPLRQAAEAVGRSVSAIRKRYQSGDLERRYHDDGRVLLELGAVRRLYEIPDDDQGHDDDHHEDVEAPPGTVLIPLSAWELTLAQLGNLHEAGQQLADAAARAARAEEQAAFHAERRQAAEERARALEAEIAALRGQSTPATTTPSTSPTSSSPASTDTPGDRSQSWWRRLRSGR